MAQLWAISCYFNPLCSARKLANYHAFRRQLTVPLVMVELSYGAQPELQKEDADLVIQLPGKDILWQRERLLSIALEAVPSHCQHVAWLDCDVIFEDDQWHNNAARLLDKCALVQPFSEVVDLPANAEPPPRGVTRAYPSSFTFAYKVSAGTDVFAEIPAGPEQRVRFGTGLGWVFRREIFEQHGFYAAGILGGNDVAMACAALGRYGVLADNWHMNRYQQTHYMNWAVPFYDAVQGQIGYVAGRIFHLWHGDLTNRRYRQRHRGLVPFAFNPFTDIALDRHRVWCWNSPKKDMWRYVEKYFAGRKEDG